jgi:hypothetical protein
MNQTSPYTVTRFHVTQAENLDPGWVTIADADLVISDTIRVSRISLIEERATGVRRIILPFASKVARLSLPLHEIASVLSAAYDDEMAHLDPVDEDWADADDAYYGSQAHQGDVPNPAIGSIDRDRS